MSKKVDTLAKRGEVRKITFSVAVPVYERLWAYLKAKYNSPWRVFSRELEQAVIEYLDRHEQEVKSELEKKVKEELKKKLIEKLGEEKAKEVLSVIE